MVSSFIRSEECSPGKAFCFRMTRVVRILNKIFKILNNSFGLKLKINTMFPSD